MLEILNCSNIFPNEDDLGGAVRGLLFLQDTYNYNITAATQGVLEYKTLEGNVRKLKGKEKMEIDDLFVLAGQVIFIFNNIVVTRVISIATLFVSCNGLCSTLA